MKGEIWLGGKGPSIRQHTVLTMGGVECGRVVGLLRHMAAGLRHHGS